MIAEYATDSAESLDAIAADEPMHVWIHGSVTYIYTGEDIPAPIESTEPA